MIELGTLNFQNAIGQGVVNLPWTTGSDTTSSYAGVTGSTASLGNGTGRATKTTTYEGGQPTEYTVRTPVKVVYKNTTYHTVYEPRTYETTSFETRPFNRGEACASGNCVETQNAVVGQPVVTRQPVLQQPVPTAQETVEVYEK